MSQAQSRKQLTHQDSQMLQRQLMLKQWQERQKHLQFPEISDGRQQNYLNQHSDNLLAANMSLMPHGASAAVQGFPTPSSINNYNQYFHLQESNNSSEKHSTQSLYGKSFLDVNQNISQGMFQQMNSLQMNASAATLDPLEQKILFNIEGPNNTLECSDYLSSFPSIESGSLSALMQTAVGESSSDHGPIQEEWGGLSNHNTKLSMDNRHSDWVDSDDVSSLNGKSRAPSGSTDVSPGFPGFQLNQKREGISLSSYESAQQGQSVEGSQLNHMMRNKFSFQNFADQSNIFAKSHDQMSIPPSFGSSFEPRLQQGNYNNATSSTGSVFMKNQHQMYSSADLKNQSPQATLPKASNKLPPFDLFIPRSASQSNSSFDLVGQQFPILEAAPVESSKKSTSPWENKLLQKSSPETGPQELPSNSQSTEQTWTHHRLESVAKNLSEVNRASSSTQDCDKQGPSVSAIDFEAFGRSLKPSNLYSNYPSSSETKQMNPVSGASSSSFSNPYVFRDTNKQYGPLRNGQMLSMTGKNSIHASSSGKQIENFEMITPPVPSDVTGNNQDQLKLLPPSTSQSELGDMDLSITISRKRKNTASDLLPWHIEVTQSSKKLQSISKAEMEWAKAANQLIEKVDNEVNMNRPKKRLVLTTQLTQQILTPPPPATLHANATQDYESLGYFSAKLALGDACNLSSCSKNGSGQSYSSDNMVTEESNASDKFSSIAEDLTRRDEKMEKDFVRLDKSTSLPEIILECKEMEKIAIINRFARFHIQRQQNESETGSSSSNLPKPAPERYVKAFRGRPIPENTQCLQL